MAGAVGRTRDEAGHQRGNRGGGQAGGQGKALETRRGPVDVNQEVQTGPQHHRLGGDGPNETTGVGFG